jgi:exoribonuclease R
VRSRPIRRAGSGASYAPYDPAAMPWHSAMGATYAHATAPLRRLADRHVVMATLAIANGRAVPDHVTAAFAALPPVMARAGARQGQIDRAVLDLAEAVMLERDVGKTFAAVVVDADAHAARIRLSELPVVARVAGTDLSPGDRVAVRLSAVDRDHRRIAFERADGRPGDLLGDAPAAAGDSFHQVLPPAQSRSGAPSGK